MPPHDAISSFALAYSPINLDSYKTDVCLDLPFATAINNVTNTVNTGNCERHAHIDNVNVGHHCHTESNRNCGQKKYATVTALLDRVVSDDGTSFAEMLDCLYSQRAVTLANKLEIVQDKIIQQAFSQEEIFTLEKYGKHYWLKNSTDNRLQLPDGHYLFIIPVCAPDQIWCAKVGQRDVKYSQASVMTKGHTSFTGSQAVHFAGMLLFQQGGLRFWNNASGHFMPPAELRYALLPYTRYVLPDSHFINHLMTLSGDTRFSSVYFSDKPSSTPANPINAENELLLKSRAMAHLSSFYKR